MAPPPKKSLFNKPSWAATNTNNESTDFFRHSDAVYGTILRDEERKKERVARKKAKAKKQDDEGTASPEKKRLKVSVTNEDQDVKWSGSERKEGSHQLSPSSPLHKSEDSKPLRDLEDSKDDGAAAVGLEERDSLTIGGPEKTRREGSDDFEILDSRPVEAKPSNSPSSASGFSEDDEDDEYVRKLKLEARENARRNPRKTKSKRTDTAPAKSSSLPPPSSTADIALTPAEPLDAPTAPALSKREPEISDKIVQILVRCPIPGSTPLLVNRRASQSFGQVREVWCARQAFAESVKMSILLTWRGKQLFDTTTSLFLLDLVRREEQQSRGALFDLDDESEDEGKKPKLRIEVTALTKDMYESHLKAVEAGKAGNEATGEGLNDGEEEEEASKKEVEYWVNLTAANHETLRLKVRPSSRISNVMNAFAKARKVAQSKKCWLVFDGERLEPEMTVGETEIEDGDAVEVHIR